MISLNCWFEVQASHHLVHILVDSEQLDKFSACNLKRNDTVMSDSSVALCSDLPILIIVTDVASSYFCCDRFCSYSRKCQT